MTDTAQSIAQEVATKVADSINSVPAVTWQHIMLAVLGALLFNLIELDRLRKTKSKFSFRIWLRLNWFPLVISALSLVTMFLLREELKDTMGFDMTNRIGCVLAGFTAHTFISKVKGVASKGDSNAHATVSSDNIDTPPSN